MLYARIFKVVPGMAVHKSWRWGAGDIAKRKLKDREPIGVTIVGFRNLNIWAAIGKWKIIHARRIVLVAISKSEYDTDLAFGLWPKLTLIRYPNWIWKLKKFDWHDVFSRRLVDLEKFEEWMLGLCAGAVLILSLLFVAAVFS